MLKKGVSAKDLRPFSMEDPHGLGIVSPTQERLRERFHRKGKGRSKSATRPRAPAAAERRTAQAATFQPTTHRTVQPRVAPRPAQPKKKSKGVGCFTTLIVLGALYAAGQLFIPLIWSALMQEYVLQTGQSAQGQILSAQATSSKWNENTVYAITLDVHAPGLQPYQASIKQALSPEQAARLTPGVWAELRYDSSDLENVAILSVGIPDPGNVSLQESTAQQEGSAQQDQILNLQKLDAAQIIADIERRTDALSKLPGTGQPRGIGSDSPPDSGAPTQEPAGSSPGVPKKDSPSASPGPAGTSPSPTPPAPAAVPAPQPVQSIALACLQATACCKVAQGKACASFSAPGTEEKSCKRALRNFSKAAETAGKSCSGLPQ